MTTIAYKNGVLAADSQLTQGDCKNPNEMKKIFRLKDGSICGGVGVYAKIFSFIKWLDDKDKTEKINLDDDTTIIHLKLDGTLDVYEDGGMYNQTCEYNASGSGSYFALSGLSLGLTAEEAVEHAKKFDFLTGGEVQSMKCEKL